MLFRSEKGGTLHTVGYALEYKRIVACYNHPSKYLTEPKTFGNQKLIREGKALAVGNDEELEEFRKKMKERKEFPQEEQATQGTLFDLL